MTDILYSGWSRPSTILFATELPTNEKAFSFALAQAVEFGAKLIIFHAYDTLVVAASDASGVRYFDYAAAAQVEMEYIEPLAQRVKDAGVECEVIVRAGLVADQILAFLRERKIDRVVLGTHCPGPIGKLLVGSVAETVLRAAEVPVFIIGPDVVDGAYRNFATRVILCAVRLHESCHAVVSLAAEMAAEHSARLVLQHVMRAHDRNEVLDAERIEHLKVELITLLPAKLQERIEVETVVVAGDPTAELLYQSHAQKADLIVMGAHGASVFSAVTHQGVVHKVLAHSQCPVMTLSPVLLERCAERKEIAHPAEALPA